MPRLAVPDPRFQASFLAAIAEPDPAHAIHAPSLGIDLQLGWSDPEVFARWVTVVAADADPGQPRSPERVATTERWWVDGDTYLGRVSLRHRLTAALRRDGGNLGYALRPSARGHGHGVGMVAAARPLLAGLGIDPALVTIEVDNVASRRVVERNDGRQVDVLGGMVRYHLPTGAYVGT